MKFENTVANRARKASSIDPTFEGVLFICISLWRMIASRPEKEAL